MILLEIRDKLFDFVRQHIEDQLEDQTYCYLSDHYLLKMISKFHPNTGKWELKIIKDQMLVRFRAVYYINSWMAGHGLESLRIGYTIHRK